MADNNNNTVAQNTLGELKVLFGTEGLGGVIKGLNTVSAQFLLTKNAAEQAIKPIKQMTTQSAKDMLNMEKYAARTGISIKEQQQMSKWLELNGLNAAQFLGQLEDLQDQIVSGRMGQGIKDAMYWFGIDPTQFATSNVADMMEMIRQGYLNLAEKDLPLAKKLLSELVGNAEDLPYLFQKSGKTIKEQINESLNKTTQLTDEENKKISEMNQSILELGVAWKGFSEKVSAFTAPGVKQFTEDLTTLLRILGGNKNAKNLRKVEKRNVATDAILGAISGAGLGLVAGGPVGALIGAIGGAAGASSASVMYNTKIPNTPSNNQYSSSLPSLPNMPAMNNGYSRPVSINQTNNVTVENVDDAEKFIIISDEALGISENNLIRATNGVNQ